jgi:hypothetical protein
MEGITIIGSDRSLNTKKIVRGNENRIFTGNQLTNLQDVDVSTLKTNKRYIFYNSNSLWNSRLIMIGGSSGRTTAFNDFVQPSLENNRSKIQYDTTLNKFYVANPDLYSQTQNSILSTAGKTALNTNAEKIIQSIFQSSPVGTGTGITYNASTYLFSITSTLSRLYIVKYQISLPFDSLTINSEYILRIRQTNITGPILGEMRYRNSSAGLDSYAIMGNFDIIVNNPNTLCFTIQLTSGAFVSSFQGISTCIISQIC